MMGWCTRRDADIADAKRDAKIEAIANARGFAAAPDWAALKTKLDTYASAHGDGEQDSSGTARAMNVIAAEQAQHDGFLDILERLSTGQIAPATPAEAAAADARLNAAWKKVMAETSAGGDGVGAPTRAGRRDAGRAWIAYRDAFLAFAARHFPDTARESLSKVLTDERTDAATGKDVVIDG
jgi:uncharacterized protein YecT (DUF1311 family)